MEILRLESQNANAEDREPLLNDTDDLNGRRNEDDGVWQPLIVHWRSYSTPVRSLFLFALVAVIGRLLIDSVYPFTSPDIPILPSSPAKIMSDVLQTFSWTFASIIVFVLSWVQESTLIQLQRKTHLLLRLLPAFVHVFCCLALTFEVVELAEYVAVFSFHPHEDILTSWVDISLLILHFFRLATIVMILVCLSLYKSTAYKLSTGEGIPIDTIDSMYPASFTRYRESYKDTMRKLNRLMPFLWPKGVYLQFLVICCFTLLALGRVVNVLVPYTYKVLVEDLSPPNDRDGPQDRSRPYFAWGMILLYTFFRFLQGGVGVLSSLQYFLWIPVGQYTSRELSVRTLEHLHSLSLNFHIHRKTGEVLRIMDRGTASIGSLLSYLVFNILPVFVDIGLAVIYFTFAFDSAIATIVFVTMLLYIILTIWITEWRTKFRREMNDLDNRAQGVAVDSLLNFETVKYFGNEQWEVNRYEQAVIAYQAADWKSSASLNVLNSAQNLVITLGLLAGLLLCAKRVVDKELTVGDFVGFITYLLQLYQPLNWFGTYYRVIQRNFIDMEKMLDLLEENQSIKDSPNAIDLDLPKSTATITFDDVSFSYDGKTPILKHVSFTVPAGKTVALVGPTGSGKSTVLRLLFRFYDTTSGSICIEDEDIRNFTQSSLRNHIGVVPQDTVLFNDSIRFNIRYGQVDATDSQVEEAAKAAQIHDRILTFPDGYDTKVGERGLRLSGGEKQRVAIARTLLKNPPIILLDEATSSLDNTTEQLIQNSLNTLSENRSTIVVAHRLSTIVDADEIIVLKNGRIVERGTHNTLLTQGAIAWKALQLQHEQQQKEPLSLDEAMTVMETGTYYLMWHGQKEPASSS